MIAASDQRAYLNGEALTIERFCHRYGYAYDYKQRCAVLADARPLPPGLIAYTGTLRLAGHPHPLPDALYQLGDVILRGYRRPLPARLRDIKGDLDLRDYQERLPDLHRIGGALIASGYWYPLPRSLVKIDGPVDLRGHMFHPPKLIISGGLDEVDEYIAAIWRSSTNSHFRGWRIRSPSFELTESEAYRYLRTKTAQAMQKRSRVIRDILTKIRYSLPIMPDEEIAR